MYAPIAIKSIPESINRRLKNCFSQYKHLFGSAINFMDIYIEIHYIKLFSIFYIYTSVFLKLSSRYSVSLGNKYIDYFNKYI